MKEKILTNLERSDMAQFSNMQIIYDALGKPATCKLIQTCGGLSFHVPQIKSLYALLSRAVPAEYDGENLARIALELETTTRHLHKFLRHRVK